MRPVGWTARSTGASLLSARCGRDRGRDVGPKDSTKMPLIEDDDVVQTLAADRADDAFDVGICQGARGAVRTGVRPKGLDRPTERSLEGRVAVVEVEPRVRVVGQRLAGLLLSAPRGRWVIGHMDMQDTSPVVGQDNAVTGSRAYSGRGSLTCQHDRPAHEDCRRCGRWRCSPSARPARVT